MTAYISRINTSPYPEFSYFLPVQISFRAHPVTYPMSRVVSLMIRRPKREIDHSPLSTAEVNNPCLSLSLIRLHGVVLKDNIFIILCDCLSSESRSRHRTWEKRNVIVYPLKAAPDTEHGRRGM
jgi:hypothetical protein